MHCCVCRLTNILLYSFICRAQNSGKIQTEKITDKYCENVEKLEYAYCKRTLTNQSCTHGEITLNSGNVSIKSGMSFLHFCSLKVSS